MRLVEMFRVNCPADAVGGALGSILGLALLASIAVNTVALAVIKTMGSRTTPAATKY